MSEQRKDPGAIAVAHRVGVIELASRSDFGRSSPSHLELQVGRLLSRYAISLPVALVVAELAFGSRREA